MFLRKKTCYPFLESIVAAYLQLADIYSLSYPLCYLQSLSRPNGKELNNKEIPTRLDLKSWRVGNPASRGLGLGVCVSEYNMPFMSGSLHISPYSKGVEQPGCREMNQCREQQKRRRRGILGPWFVHVLGLRQHKGRLKWVMRYLAEIL